MKPLTIALIAGAAAAALLLFSRARAATPGDTRGPVTRLQDWVDRTKPLAFFEDSYNYALYGHPRPTTAAIPPESGWDWAFPAPSSQPIGFWDLVQPPSWPRNVTTFGEPY